MNFENSLHYFTFGDKSQVTNLTDVYDTVILPSHLLAGGAKSVPTLINKLVEQEGLEYYIDPTVTQFRRGDNFEGDKGDLREWHSKLVDWHGDSIQKILEDHGNLLPSKISDEELEDISTSVCDFQTNFIQEQIEEEAGKYGEAVGGDLAPKAIIPWYTKITSTDHVEFNNKILTFSQENCDNNLKPCVHVSKDFLRLKENRESIIGLLEGADVSDMFLWVDNLSKYDTTKVEYKKVIMLVNELYQSDINPHMLFGDFFSNILYYFGCAGIGFGTYHSEEKEEKLATSSGGGFLQRYYLDQIKTFASTLAASNILEEGGVLDDEDIGGVCECQFCEGVVEKPRDITKHGDDHDFLKNHFIAVKNLQKERLARNDLGDYLRKFELAREKYEVPFANYTSNPKHTLDYLDIWSDAISESIEGGLHIEGRNKVEV